MSDRRTLANHTNASKSTGPKTDTGKSVVGTNAIRHGIFSDKLFLEDEDPVAFTQLQLDLQAALMPVGALELSLVERIAVNMWRQRRLIAAETASLHLSRERRQVTDAVNSHLGRWSSTDKYNENDLEPFNLERERWCQSILSELDQLEDFELGHIQAKAPLVYAQIAKDAEDDRDEPCDFVATYPGGLTAYIDELHTWCSDQMSAADERPELLALAEQVKATKLVLPYDALNLFARYQTTLDNQIHKSLKALREAQDWRLNTLEAEASASDAVDEAN